MTTRIREPMTRQMLRSKQRQVDTKEDRHKKHFHAQKLNNIAASCIDAGEYDKAVAVLVKALCLSPIDQNQSGSMIFDDEDICTCSSCSLDDCIGYSEDRAASRAARRESCHAETTRDDDDDSSYTSKKRRIDVPKNPLNAQPELEESTTGYTHRRPIFVPPKICNEGHIMGPVLSLIVTFNLALASHLKLILSPDSGSEMTEERRMKILKVLRLYELAYRWQLNVYEGQVAERERQSDDESFNDSCSSFGEKQQQDAGLPSERTTNGTSAESSYQANLNNCSSIRFDMIVCNNLSQIHNLLGNFSKQEQCLQHLLSLMMYVVDWQRHRNFEEQHEDEEQEQQQAEESPDRNCESLGSSSSSLAWIPEDQLRDVQETERSGKPKRSKTYMELDGFWRNITPFILRSDCAEAA